jgi:hypothetical protein
MTGPKVSRELKEMSGQLERQLALLEEYSRKAFDDKRREALPEVAGKLRILLVRSRSNIPLLFEVARQIGETPRVVLDCPPLKTPSGEPGPGDEITLDAFFDLSAVVIRTSAGLVSMTKRELIRAWAEQLGGVHEDWSVDEALVNALRSPVLLGGMEPSVIELRNCARVTLQNGQRVLQSARGKL